MKLGMSFTEYCLLMSNKKNSNSGITQQLHKQLRLFMFEKWFHMQTSIIITLLSSSGSKKILSILNSFLPHSIEFCFVFFFFFPSFTLVPCCLIFSHLLLPTKLLHSCFTSKNIRLPSFLPTLFHVIHLISNLRHYCLPVLSILYHFSLFSRFKEYFSILNCFPHSTLRYMVSHFHTS